MMCITFVLLSLFITHHLALLLSVHYDLEEYEKLFVSFMVDLGVLNRKRYLRFSLGYTDATDSLSNKGFYLKKIF